MSISTGGSSGAGRGTESGTSASGVGSSGADGGAGAFCAEAVAAANAAATAAARVRVVRAMRYCSFVPSNDRVDALVRQEGMAEPLRPRGVGRSARCDAPGP